MRNVWIMMAVIVLLGQACAPRDLPKKSNNDGADAVQNEEEYRPNNNGNYNNNGNSHVVDDGDIVLEEQQNQKCYKADETICKIELAILDQTNGYRAQRGLSPVAHSYVLAFASRDWSQSQAGRGFIGHAGFPSRRMTVVNQEFGSSQGVGMSGENVAYTSVGSSDPEAVARTFSKMWWNSSGHRRNMLGNHKILGVGVFKKGQSTYYATQIFGK